MSVLSVRSFRKYFIIMSNSEKKSDVFPVSIKEVEDYVVVIRGVPVIADADVAALYGVETKRVNEAVRNNPDKFPSSYSFELNVRELRGLRTKISSTNVSTKNTKKMHAETDKNVQTTIMKQFGEVLTDIVMPDLETSETESSLEINFLIGKLKHSVKRVKKLNNDK